MDVLAKKLSIIERITQTESEDLLEQVDTLLNQNIVLSEEHRTILDERLNAHRADPNSGSPWEEVKERVRKSLGA